MYKLIIAGGRDFDDVELMVSSIKSLRDMGLFTSDNLEVVSGLARGADMLGKELAEDNGVPVKPFKADWKDMSEPCVVGTNKYGKYNKLAGMKRNHAMGDYADGLLAFWDGRSKGTKDMIDYMDNLSKSVVVIRY